MRILGRFDGIHRRLDALERILAERQTASSNHLDDTAATLRNDLRDLSRDLDQTASQWRNDAATLVNGAALGLSGQARSLADTLHGVLDRLGRDVAAVDAVAHNLTAGQAEAAEAVAVIRRMLDAVLEDTRAATGALATLTTTQQRQTAELAALRAELAAGLGQLGDSLGESVRGAAAGIATPLAGLEHHLSAMAGNMAGGLDGLGHRMDAAAETAARHLDQRLDGLDQRLSGLDSHVAAAAQAASQQVGVLPDHLERMAGGLSQRLDEMAAGLSLRLDETTAGLSLRLEETAAGLSLRLDETAGTLASLDGQAERMAEAVAQRLSDPLAALERNLGDLTHRHELMAEAVARQRAPAHPGHHAAAMPAGDGPQPPPPATLPPIYFIVGCGRSGTTSLARILNRASNGICHNEPAPVLGHEARLLHEGRLAAPFAALRDTIGRRITDALDQGLAYGEKNLTLPPFIPYLHALFRCRFVHVVRDGREVVRSWQDWHNLVYGTVYRECAETGPLSARAMDWMARFSVAEDIYDIARPRPLPGDTWADDWMGFSRLEMLAWYWAHTNDSILDALERLPAETWRRADYSAIHGRHVVDIARFLGLNGLDEAEVETLVRSRINRLEEKAADGPRFPAWPDWDDGQKVAFDAIAATTMRRLGYYPPDHIRHCPADFAACWRADAPETVADLDWLAARLAPASVIEACADDSGRHFPAAVTTTMDAARWLARGDRGRAQLAVARAGALRRIHDVEAAIARLADTATEWVFLSFPDSGAAGHRHRREAASGRFDNSVSAAAVRRQLTALGIAVTDTAVVDGHTVMLARLGRTS